VKVSPVSLHAIERVRMYTPAEYTYFRDEYFVAVENLNYFIVLAYITANTNQFSLVLYFICFVLNSKKYSIKFVTIALLYTVSPRRGIMGSAVW
jgi:hypothetical protein